MMYTPLVNEIVLHCRKTEKIVKTSLPYAFPQDKLYVLLDIPKAGDYQLLVKYTLEGPEVRHTQVTVQFKNSSVSGQEAGELFNFSVTLQECTNCPATINNPYVFMKKGQWMVNITTLQSHDQLKLVNRRFLIELDDL